MDKYDKLYNDFMKKARLLEVDAEFKKEKNGLYTLERIKMAGNTLVLNSFVGKIDLFALEACHNLTELYLPDTLTSFRLLSHPSLIKYNIPAKVRGVSVTVTSAPSISITLEGCRKSVQQSYAASCIRQNNCVNINIINSHLIDRVNKNSFYCNIQDAGCVIKELKLLDTYICRYSFHDITLDKLYISKYTHMELSAMLNCNINELYFFVETKEERDKLLNIIRTSIGKLTGFNNCKIGRFEIIVRPTLRADIASLTAASAN